MEFAGFIEPDHSLADMADPAGALGIEIYSGYNAVNDTRRFKGQNAIFDRIVKRIKSLDLPYEDQCSSKYYFDLVRTLRDFNGEFSRVVEVGVFMGGASGILAGCSEAFDFDLDLVDIDPRFLRFSYERIRRMYPEAAKRVRLFHGDLAAYVRYVMLQEPEDSYIVHHDGAHDFNQVVRDLAALSFVRDRLHSVIAQDTHLRGTLDSMNFVDMAIYAVFGTDLSYLSIGTAYREEDNRTAPNRFQGNYFMPDAYEGLVIPMAANDFRYPHPALKIEDFLPAHASLETFAVAAE